MKKYLNITIFVGVLVASVSAFAGQTSKGGPARGPAEAEQYHILEFDNNGQNSDSQGGVVVMPYDCRIEANGGSPKKYVIYAQSATTALTAIQAAAAFNNLSLINTKISCSAK
jgi:hypothetical protein